jgi:2-polyprenyl-6-hydroxyphenyl methylase/3-demethylubiquinone-9 3-methyltransferase
MAAHLDPVSAADLGPCKICGGAVPLYLVVDFNRSCEDGRGYQLPLSGVPVYYGRCVECGFLFTRFFDQWSAADFAEHVYNADYIKVDPEHEMLRPIRVAPLVPNLFPTQLINLSILDWGGGSGVMKGELERFGAARVECYDPFIPKFATRPAGHFKLVTCFEVIEHLTDPKAALSDMVSFLDPDEGALLISTSPQPDEIYIKTLQWFYLAPRNAHLSLFTDRAIKRLCDDAGLQVRKIFNDVFFCYRQAPAYAADLLRKFDGNRIAD